MNDLENDEIYSNRSTNENTSDANDKRETTDQAVNQKTNFSNEEKCNFINSQKLDFSKAYLDSHTTELVTTNTIANNCKQVNQRSTKNVIATGNPVQEAKAQRTPKKPPQRALLAMLLDRKVYEEIKRTIGTFPAETGGLLLGSVEDFKVTEFIFDSAAYKRQRWEAVWFPHTESLNKHVDLMEKRGLAFLGVVHSHPRGVIRPSGPDKWAAWSNMTSENNPHLNAYLLPIVQSDADGHFEIHCYVAICHPEGLGRVIVKEVGLKLIN
jgi:proteasome lid subunit RPN8/RPN11